MIKIKTQKQVKKENKKETKEKTIIGCGINLSYLIREEKGSKVEKINDPFSLVS